MVAFFDTGKNTIRLELSYDASVFSTVSYHRKEKLMTPNTFTQLSATIIKN